MQQTTFNSAQASRSQLQSVPISRSRWKARRPRESFSVQVFYQQTFRFWQAELFWNVWVASSTCSRSASHFPIWEWHCLWHIDMCTLQFVLWSFQMKLHVIHAGSNFPIHIFGKILILSFYMHLELLTKAQFATFPRKRCCQLMFRQAARMAEAVGDDVPHGDDPAAQCFQGNVKNGEVRPRKPPMADNVGTHGRGGSTKTRSDEAGDIGQPGDVHSPSVPSLR